MSAQRSMRVVDVAHALDDYLDALLNPGATTGQTARPATEAEVADVATVPDTAVPVAATPAIEASNPELEYRMLSVQGLRFAVPAGQVLSVVPADAKARAPQAGPPWRLGEASDGTHTQPVADLAFVVLPKSRVAALTAGDSARLQSVVLLRSGWALACDEAGSVQALHMDEVHWRTETGTRAWLAGTVPKLACAVLDVTALTQLMNPNESTI